MTERRRDCSWADKAKCASSQAEQLFSTSAVQREMRDLCRTCCVRLFCLADAMQSNMRYGLWGGLTERERRQLQRLLPPQEDWYLSITTSDDPVFIALREGRSFNSVAGACRKSKGKEDVCTPEGAGIREEHGENLRN